LQSLSSSIIYKFVKVLIVVVLNFSGRKGIQQSNRIEAAFFERVATQNPTNCPIRPAPQAMTLDSFNGILGAGWRITATWRQ